MKTSLILVDSFKGTFSSARAGGIIKSAFLRAGFGSVDCLPVSDGGEGFADAAAGKIGGNKINAAVTGPLFEKTDASYILAGKTAVIESAEACGLKLVPKSRRDPLKTTTYGVGELVAHAVLNGAEDIIIGLGGSATNDGGTGFACALGGKFYGTRSPVPVGGTLKDITSVDLSAVNAKYSGVSITGCYDVSTPFCGEDGASRVYSPQKGADQAGVEILEAGMKNLAGLISPPDLFTLRGGGAAGGLGGGIAAFTGGSLKRGFDYISSLLKLEEIIPRYDLVVTGEGKTDPQTLYGKLPAGVAAICLAKGVDCFLISGAVVGDLTKLYGLGVTKSFAAAPPYKEGESINITLAEKNLYSAALRAAGEFLDGYPR